MIPKIFSSQGYWICPFCVVCQWGIWTYMDMILIWRLLPQPPIIWGACAPAITGAPNVTVHCCNVDPVLTNSIWANRPFLHWWETSPTNPSIIRKKPLQHQIQHSASLPPTRSGGWRRNNQLRKLVESLISPLIPLETYNLIVWKQQTWIKWSYNATPFVLVQRTYLKF